MSGIIGVSPDMRSGVVGKHPAGHELQTVGVALRSYAVTGTVAVTGTGEVIVDGFLKSIIPKRTDSNFIVSTGNWQAELSGGGRLIMRLYCRISTTDTGVNFDDIPDESTSPEQIFGDTVTFTTQSTSGWDLIGTIAYSSSNHVYGQTNFIRNSTVPTYTAGQTVQFAISIYSDYSGGTITVNVSGNRSAAGAYFFISEIGA